MAGSPPQLGASLSIETKNDQPVLSAFGAEIPLRILAYGALVYMIYRGVEKTKTAARRKLAARREKKLEKKHAKKVEKAERIAAKIKRLGFDVSIREPSQFG